MKLTETKTGFKFTANTSVFAQEIEDICWDKDVNYIEAVTIWCENHNIEVEYVAQHIRKDPVLKGKLQFDAEQLNYMKKSPKLIFE